MANHPKFLLKTGANNKFYFSLTAKNGQVVLSSQGYSEKSAARNGIESVKKNAGNDNAFERKEAKDGSPYFALKAGNGEIIGSSEMYSSKSAMENGIKSVQENAPSAEIESVLV